MKKVIILLLVLTLPGSLTAQEVAPAKQVYLLEEDGRLIVSNNRFSRFDELKLNARERIVEKLEAKSVVLVATNQRLIGYGVLTGFRDLKTEAGERIVELKAEDYAGLVITNRRLLNFNGKSGVWGQRGRP